jgi:vancomycin resistance protein YoaR
MQTLRFFLTGFVLAAVLGTALPAHAADLTQELAVDPAKITAVKNKPFVLTLGTRKWTVAAAVASKWFKTRSLDQDTLALQLRPGAIYDYLNVHVSPTVNDLGEKGRFVLEGKTIKVLAAGRKGKIVDGEKTSLAIRSALAKGQNTAAISLKEFRPFPMNEKEFATMRFPHNVGRGETNFAGSPRNRIHNIRVATERFNGLVLMPGETFSVNQYLGNVDAKNGYLPELVIKNNVTTPEYGGGICQVSTTAFRAGMQTGLPIIERRNHSYPVRYYGTPGYDATVYAPTTDLKFTNDFKHPLYFRTSIQGSRLIFDVWGTNDGRQVKVNGPFVTSRKPDGSLTAAVAQIITKGGKTVREQNFVSLYQPPDKFPTVKAAGE